MPILTLDQIDALCADALRRAGAKTCFIARDAFDD